MIFPLEIFLFVRIYSHFKKERKQREEKEERKKVPKKERRKRREKKERKNMLKIDYSIIYLGIYVYVDFEKSERKENRKMVISK